jgi:hypothetical protein
MAISRSTVCRLVASRCPASAGDAFRALETIAEDSEAGKDTRLHQPIEDGEVGERPGLTRSL